MPWWESSKETNKQTKNITYKEFFGVLLWAYLIMITDTGTPPVMKPHRTPIDLPMVNKLLFSI